MDLRATNQREAAADLIAECGPYATMAALFLASESREDGDTDGALFWVRIAAVISENSSTRSAGLRVHVFGGAGQA